MQKQFEGGIKLLVTLYLQIKNILPKFVMQTYPVCVLMQDT